MWSRVCVTVGRLSLRPSVCLSHRSAATAAGWFAAECRRLLQMLIVGALLQAFGSKCG